MNAAEDRLQPLIVFLRSTGDVQFSRFFSRVRSDLSTAGSNRERRAAAQRGLAAFAGMNSFNDLVIMGGTMQPPN
ncbi:MAG: hypothetical protein KA158_04915 [Leucobacter sp.]|nr:hypothetical protein [Leucobacter sp.]